MLLYWPHTSALVAYNGGTSIGFGPVKTLLLSPILFSVPIQWMVAMAVSRLSFLGPILCLVPMTPCETMLYWPHTSALVACNGGTSIGHGPARTIFPSPDFVPSADTMDGGWSCHDSFSWA